MQRILTQCSEKTPSALLDFHASESQIDLRTGTHRYIKQDRFGGDSSRATLLTTYL